MKFALALLSLVGVASAAMKPLVVNDMAADSEMGMKLLSKARRLDQNNYQANGNQYDASAQYSNGNQNQAYNNNGQQDSYNQGGGVYDQYGNYNNDWADQNQQQFQNWYMSMHTWVKDYSIKFQGCHHVSEWNQDAEDEDDVRIWTRRLIKFRLCPTNSCNDNSAEGCSGGYGDYIIDIETFLEAYVEAKEAYQGWMEAQAEDNGQEYYGNNYEAYDISELTYCQASEIEYEGDENGNNGQNDGDNWDGTLYMGPYCAEQGGAINIGLFTDEKCSQFVDSKAGKSLYYNAMGVSMPFSGTNLVEMSCFPCSEPTNQYAYYNDQGDDADDDNEVCEACENLYTMAGKCEENMAVSSENQNNKACNYLEGIAVIRKDGTIVTTNRGAAGSRSGEYKGAFAFVGIFSAGFVLLSAYVYYLKEKLDRASIQLAE